MSDFRDPELENMLGRLSGSYPDTNVAYSAVAGRVRQAKRRRAFVATTAACVALLGVGVLAVQGGGQGQNLQPASELSDESTTESTVNSLVLTAPSTSDDSKATDNSVANSTEASPAVSSDTTNKNNSGPGTSTGKSSGTSGSSNTTSNSGSANSGPATSGTSTSGSSNPTVSIADQNRGFNSAGGSIQVQVANNALALAGTTPANGFTATTKHDRGDRVEVEFTDGSVTWVIRVDLKHGVITSEITTH
jgi:hypothetical protein